LPYFCRAYKGTVKVRQKYDEKATKVGRKEAAYIRGIFFLPPALGLLHAFIKIWMWNVALSVSTFSFRQFRIWFCFQSIIFLSGSIDFTENKTISF